MSTDSTPGTFLQRVRYRWLRFAFWWFLVLGVIGVAIGVIGTILSFVGDNAEVTGPWWLQVIVVAFCGLFVAVGLKGLKIKSALELEADSAHGQQRIARFLSWLAGASPKEKG